MNEDLKNDINNIVWWIPFKKLRNSVRNILIANFEYSKSEQNQNIENPRYMCPICGWRGKKFNNWSESYQNVVCPQCQSHPRHRLFYFYLLHKININKHLKVCHFAPEESVKNIFNMFKNVEYLSCDISPDFAMCVQDITNTTFSNNSFDIVFCSHVLEHIKDDIKAMEELKRIMKPDGFAIICVPLYTCYIGGKLKGEKLLTTYEDFSITDPKKREIEFGQSDHVRLYEKKDFINRLKKAGFNVTEDNISDKINNEVVIKYGINSSDSIFYCTKN